MVIIKIKRNSNTFQVKTKRTTLQVFSHGKRGIQGVQGAQGPAGDPATNLVDSVNGQTGVVVLDTGDIAEVTDKNYVSDAEKTELANISGVNTGDQDLSGLVPKTTTVNGHALSANVTVSKSDVGLGNADNTSDANKPVSTAQAAADAVIQADIDAHEADVANPHSVTKTQVGLGNADNTSDANKPVSTAQAVAIAVVQSDVDTHEADTANPHAVTKTQVGLSNVDNTSDASKPVSTAQQTALDLKLDDSQLDTDATLAANSDTKIASQKAVKAYADGLIAANDALVFKGVIDASSNPNYPAANAGHLYKISVAGKIGGASGINVEVGDSILCTVDGTSAGTQAAVGANWSVIQVNIDGAVIGPASSTDNAIVRFDLTTGKLIQNSGATVDDSGNITATNVSGTNTGNETTTTEGALISGATAKSTPVDADFIGLMDSAASNILKKLSWLNVKATLKTYFDTLYPSGSGTSTGTNTGDQTLAGLGGANTALGNLASVAVNLSLTPASNNAIDLGTASILWRTAYLATSLIAPLHIGGAASGGSLTLQSTSHATRGNILFGTSAYDEANNRLGIITTAPTHSITIGNGGSQAFYNTADQTTNYERLSITVSANIFAINTENAGSGTQRNLRIGDSTQYLEDAPGASGGNPKFTLTRTTSSSASLLLLNHAGMTGSSGNQYGLAIQPTINQTSTAGYEALRISVTESATGSGAKNLINALVAAASVFSVNNQGVVFPRQAATASAPTYVKGGMYFDTTLNKMRIGGASAWESVTSV